jgi:CubicO group peptidase (beta-lactamase class C family)
MGPAAEQAATQVESDAALNERLDGLAARVNAISRQFPDQPDRTAFVPEQREAQRVLWQTTSMLSSGIRNRRFPGAQLYVSLHGKPVASFGLGRARDGVEMTSATLLPWFCNIKPIIAVAFAKLWQEGKLNIDGRVVDHIPEFGKSGKEAITFRHILTHATGLKKDPVRPMRFEPRDNVLRCIYDTPASQGSVPGFAAKYSVFWGWAILSEVIRRVTGLTYDEYIGESLLAPIKLDDFWLQMPPAIVDDHLQRFGLLFGLDRPAPYVWPTKARLDHYDRDQPATSLIATAQSVGRAYEGILQHRYLWPTTTEAITAKHRVGLYDENFRGFVSFGLGMAVDGSYFGSYCSARTYGHKGLNSSCVLVDPEYQLVLAFIVNGLVNTEVSDQRDRRIIDSVYRDLGIGDGRPPAPRITQVDHHRTIDWSPG